MNERLQTVLSFLFIVTALIAAHYLGWLRVFERAIRTVINPLASTAYEWSVATQEGPRTFTSIQELQEAYLELTLDYQRLLVASSDSTQLSEENAALRAQLSFRERTGRTGTGARVIGKDIDPLGSTILIDKGSDHGVTLGAAVIVGDGILVGVIKSVDTNSASVLLLDDSQSKVAAAIVGDERSVGLVEGGFGLAVRMNLIPQNEIVQIGDTVTTSGLSQTIPPGLVIGTIEAVEREAFEPFQTAIIRPATNLDKISLVTVLPIETL